MMENQKPQNNKNNLQPNSTPPEETFTQYALRKQNEKTSENIDSKTLTNDIFCTTLAKTIEQNSKQNLNELIQKTGYARQTVHNHLKHLLNNGILRKEIITNGRGRPTILYYRTNVGLSEFLKPTVVIIAFNRLKHICRFEKGGRCRERKEAKCSFEDCPIIANKLPK
jgi:predicted transcriptional regulator